MLCKHFNHNVVAYIDGDLSPKLHAAMRDHLLACPECRAEWVSLQRLSNQCRDRLAYRGPRYAFSALTQRMATMEPLDEITAFLPNLKLYGWAPRLAVSFLVLLLAGDLFSAIRQSPRAYEAARSNIAQRNELLTETLDALEKENNRSV